MNTDAVLVTLAWLGTYLVHSTLLLGTVALLARRRTLSQPRLVERMWKVAALGGILTASAQVALVSDPVLGSLSLGALGDIAARENAGAESSSELEGTVPAASAAMPRATRPGRDTVGRGTRSAPLDFRPREAFAPRSPGPRSSPAGAPPSGLSPESSVRTLPTLRATVVEAEPGSAELEDAEPAPLLATSSTPTAPTALPWRPAVVSTWALVGGWGLLGFLFAWSRLCARLSARRVLKSGLLVDCLAELCRRSGVKQRIRLTASASIDSPITHGWIRREICVPERALIDLSPSQLESTLAHELAHVLRRDPLWFGILALLERVLFFQPLNRVARRELQEIAEFVCDDWAVRWTGGRLALASALTEIAHWIVGRRQLALPSPGMASSRLGDRVERLLDDRLARTPEPARAWLPPTALGALGLVVFAVPGVTSARTTAPIPAPDETPEHLTFEFTPALPAPRGEPRPARESALGIRTDQELLDHELQLLEAEFLELRQELDETRLYDQFEHALGSIERRMDGLRSRKARLSELFSRVLSEDDNHPDETP